MSALGCYPLSPCGGGLGWGVAARQQCSCDIPEHSIGPSKYLAVPESKNSKPLLLKPFAAVCIVFHLKCVLATVQFDRQFPFQADEIQHIIANGKLPTEHKSVHLSPAQPPPQEPFGLGRTLPQESRNGVYYSPPP